jgi:HEPN domain-containing protein
MCISRPRKFTKENGYTEKDLLHYAIDHLKSAKVLFEGPYDLYDSAGYLSHLGIEMILKSMLLNRKGEFPGVHKLGRLCRHLKQDIPLTNEQKRLIKKLDQFEELRYPNPQKAMEIGDEDWESINSLANFLLGKLPKKLREEFKEIDPTKKGGRIVMSKQKNNLGT